jgi:hypothetical protein
MLARPSDDVHGILDDLTIVEHEDGNEAFARQPLDCLAAGRDVRQRREALDPHHIGSVSGVLPQARLHGCARGLHEADLRGHGTGKVPQQT